MSEEELKDNKDIEPIKTEEIELEIDLEQDENGKNVANKNQIDLEEIELDDLVEELEDEAEEEIEIKTEAIELDNEQEGIGIEEITLEESTKSDEDEIVDLMHESTADSSLNEILEIVKSTVNEVDSSIPALEVKNYTKKFRKFTATSDVNFEVGHGVIHGFIGPNGSGKTTTIKAMIGAYVPTEGEILINGHNAGSTKANKLIGYIPERASFPKHLNTLKYLTAMGELSGVSSKESKKRAWEILKALKMEKQAKRKPINFHQVCKRKFFLLNLF